MNERIELIDINGDTASTDSAKKLLLQYGSYMFDELGLIAGKESFFKQLENFPGNIYLPPSGIFVIAKAGAAVMGCVGIKKFDDENCEMKRMFVSPEYRGKSIGSILCNFVIEWCHNSPYKGILLDTNLEMKNALLLYHKCGFKEIQPYCINENDHPVFMKYVL